MMLINLMSSLGVCSWKRTGAHGPNCLQTIQKGVLFNVLTSVPQLPELEGLLFKCFFDLVFDKIFFFEILGLYCGFRLYILQQHCKINLGSGTDHDLMNTLYRTVELDSKGRTRKQHQRKCLLGRRRRNKCLTTIGVSQEREIQVISHSVCSYMQTPIFRALQQNSELVRGTLQYT